MVGSAVDLCAWNEVRVAANELVQDLLKAHELGFGSAHRHTRLNGHFGDLIDCKVDPCCGRLALDEGLDCQWKSDLPVLDVGRGLLFKCTRLFCWKIHCGLCAYAVTRDLFRLLFTGPPSDFALAEHGGFGGVRCEVYFHPHRIRSGLPGAFVHTIKAGERAFTGGFSAHPARDARSDGIDATDHGPDTVCNVGLLWEWQHGTNVAGEGHRWYAIYAGLDATNKARTMLVPLGYYFSLCSMFCTSVWSQVGPFIGTQNGLEFAWSGQHHRLGVSESRIISWTNLGTNQACPVAPGSQATELIVTCPTVGGGVVWCGAHVPTPAPKIGGE